MISTPDGSNVDARGTTEETAEVVSAQREFSAMEVESSMRKMVE